MKNKDITILVLFVIILIIIVSFLYLEKGYYKSSKSSKSSKSKNNLEESFTTNEEEDLSNELYKTTPNSHLEELYHRTEPNLIGNGNFNNKHDIDGHYGNSFGNKIISFPNPGKGPYALKQSTSTKNKTITYKIATRIKAGRYYKLSSWVYQSHHLHHNTNDIYKLLIHLKNEHSIKHQAKAISVQTSTIDGNLWSQEDIIFQVPHESNGSLDIILEFNNNGKQGDQYITDVWLEEYHPILRSFPAHNKLAFFLSSSIEKGFDKKDDRLWKDISNNGKDFLFSSNTHYTGNAVNLSNNMIIGPPCSELGLKATQFTIGWYMSCKHFKGNRIFMKLFTSADHGSQIDIAYNSKHHNYSSVTVSFLGKKTEWDIGFIDNLNVYVLVYNGKQFHLYKDGIFLTSLSEYGISSETSSHKSSNNPHNPTPKPTSIPTSTPTSTPSVKPDDSSAHNCNLEDGDVWCPSKTKCTHYSICPEFNIDNKSQNDHETRHSTQSEASSKTGPPHKYNSLFFINKPLLINPNKDFIGSIYNVFAYNTTLTNDILDSINSYFQCAPCKKLITLKPHFPIKPIHKHDITRKKKQHNRIIEEENYEKEQRCKVLIERANQNKNNNNKNKKVSILCDAHNFRDTSPNKSQNMVDSLVTAFNKKETDTSDPCTKIVYHIKPDGKVIRKKMAIPNCEECPLKSMNSEVES